MWASDPAGFGQVGCVYTAQGPSTTGTASILGPDLVRRGDRWVAQPSTSKDPGLRGITNDDADVLLRNV